MNYKIAIFDMDGTILDTLEDLADAMNHCLIQYQLPERNLDEIRCFVGNGLHKLVERAVPENTPATTVEDIFHALLLYYKEHCAIKTKPYDGVIDVINRIRECGILTAVVSNKADSAVKKLCEDYFPDLFDAAIGDKEGQRRKPYPDSVNAVLKKFGVSKEHAVYVGDSEVDFNTARNAGIDLIMVGWGFRQEKDLLSLGIEKVLHEPEEILTQILNR